MRKLLLFFLSILFLSSCAKKEEASDDSNAIFNSSYKVTNLAAVGSIHGIVSLLGAMPNQLVVETQRDQAVCGVSHPNPSLPSPNGIQGCAVWLEGIKEGKDFGFAANPKMDQTGCEFLPHILLVKQGATIVIHNSDAALHNFHVINGDATIVNEAQPEGAPPREVTLTKAGLHRVSCDVHPWMRGFIMVAEHPYYVITDSLGNFTLENVPPGKYTIKLWRDNWNIESVKNPAGKIISYKFPVDFVKGDSVIVETGKNSQVMFTL